MLQERSGAPDVENEIQAQADDANRHSSARDTDSDTTTPTVPATSKFQPAVGAINRQQENTGVPVRAAPLAAATRQTGATETGKVEALLAQARRALDDYRLVTPEDNNAHEYLLAALQLDPANETARAGIQEIIDIYITLASKAADKDDMERAERLP